MRDIYLKEEEIFTNKNNTSNIFFFFFGGKGTWYENNPDLYTRYDIEYRKCDKSIRYLRAFLITKEKP